jgi:hypothetical protein
VVQLGLWNLQKGEKERDGGKRESETRLEKFQRERKRKNV